MPLTNSQHQTLMRMYEEKQQRSRDLLNHHFAKVYAAIPEIAEIDASISDCSVRQARKLLEGDDGAIAELKQDIAQLASRRKALLLEGGFPADYLEPTYECPVCEDTGYVDGHKCQCYRKSVIDLFYTQSNLSDILEQENFDTFSFDYYSSNYMDKLSGISSLSLAERAWDACHHFIETFDHTHGNLLLFGTTGIGKTFLTHCIAREIMQSVHSVLYLTATDFFDALLGKALNREDQSAILCEQIASCDLLIIDDLGTERNTEFVISQLFVCLNERILNHKSTVISTNLTLEEIKGNYTERTFSRISNHFKMIRLAGDDIRIKKKLMKREAN